MDLLSAYGSDSEGEPSSCPALSSQEKDSDPAPKRIKLDPAGAGAPSTAPSLPDPAALLDRPLSCSTQQPTARAASASAGKEQHHGIASGAQPAAFGHTSQQHAAADRLAEPPRVMSFPHVEGNFPTVTYIPLPNALHQQLQALTSSLVAQCPAATAVQAGAALAPSAASASAHTELRATDSRAEMPSGAANGAPLLRLWPTFPFSNSSQQQQPAQEQREQQLPLHMSVSRTLPIRHGQIASLKAALAKQLKGFRPFKVQLQGLVCLLNDNGSRSFVGVGVTTSHQQVVRLIEAVNRAFIMHGLEPFYKDPRPHVSLAWTPGDQIARLQPWLDTYKHTPIAMQVSQVVCQVGKTKHVVWEA